MLHFATKGLVCSRVLCLCWSTQPLVATVPAAGASTDLTCFLAQSNPSWPAITYNVNYLVGHTLADPLERYDALNWWLGRGGWTAITSAAQLAKWGPSAAAREASYMGPLEPHPKPGSA